MIIRRPYTSSRNFESYYFLKFVQAATSVKYMYLYTITIHHHPSPKDFTPMYPSPTHTHTHHTQHTHPNTPTHHVAQQSQNRCFTSYHLHLHTLYKYITLIPGKNTVGEKICILHAAP